MTTTRPVRPDDAPALHRLLAARERHVLGRPDSTLDDARGLLDDPDLDPASCVLLDDDGRARGLVAVLPDGDSGRVDLEVVAEPGSELLPALVDHALRLARQAVAGRGGGHVQADQGCYRADLELAAVLEAAGFVPATSFHRMRRELDEPVAAPLPDGLRIEQVEDQDEPSLRRAHRLHTSTFAGHFGFTARPWEEWLTAHRARPGRGLLWFAEQDGTDVGFLHETDQFVEDEDAGYVLRLGVEPAARGRGVARALLLSAFAAMRERGRRAALLHVDSANATGATALYESVGMRPVVVIDVWRWSGPSTG